MSKTSGVDVCLECGAEILLCEHAVHRIVDPVTAFQGKVIGEVRELLAAERARADRAEAEIAELRNSENSLAAAVAELRASLAEHRSVMFGMLTPMMDGSERRRAKDLLARPSLASDPTTRGRAILKALEVFADLAQLVLDRITDGATNEERYLMRDTARIAMERYRALDHAYHRNHAYQRTAARHVGAARHDGVGGMAGEGAG